MICKICKKADACTIFSGYYAGWCGKCVRTYVPPMTLEEIERVLRHMDAVALRSGFKPPRKDVKLRALGYMFESRLRVEEDTDEDPVAD